MRVQAAPPVTAAAETQAPLPSRQQLIVLCLSVLFSDSHASASLARDMFGTNETSVNCTVIFNKDTPIQLDFGRGWEGIPFNLLFNSAFFLVCCSCPCSSPLVPDASSSSSAAAADLCLLAAPSMGPAQAVPHASRMRVELGCIVSHHSRSQTPSICLRRLPGAVAAQRMATGGAVRAA